MSGKEPLISAAAETGIAFDMINESFNPSGDALRDTGAYTVKSTGWISGNTEAAEALAKFLRNNGFDHETCHLKYGANPALGLVALYGSKLQEVGTMSLRWSTGKKKGVTFHLGAVFRKYPELRPKTTVEVFFHTSTDAIGRPCLILKLQGALAKRKGSRTSDGQVAAGKDEQKND